MLHDSLARRALLSLVTAALVLAALPGLNASANGPIRVDAREVSVALERERVVELPIEASHVALHWRGQHEAALTVALSADNVAFGPASPSPSATRAYCAAIFAAPKAVQSGPWVPHRDRPAAG